MSLEILRSDLLSSVRHGFFSRRGGASSGIYSGLNCGPGSGDQSGAVAVNRARVAAAIGVAPDRLLSPNQVHSTEVVMATGPWTERPRADAVVTVTPGIALGILTADCAPILLADREASVIGAAHAGWRGALEGVIEATIEAMERLGASAPRIAAAVGPCISQRAYEVGPEFLERFFAAEPEYDRFFVGGTQGRYRFDLPAFVLQRLRGAGVGAAGWIGRCTYSDHDRFFSYRRSTHAREPDYGRLISVIAL